jgi:hypothetical protein
MPGALGNADTHWIENDDDREVIVVRGGEGERRKKWLDYISWLM